MDLDPIIAALMVKQSADIVLLIAIRKRLQRARFEQSRWPYKAPLPYRQFEFSLDTWDDRMVVAYMRYVILS